MVWNVRGLEIWIGFSAFTESGEILVCVIRLGIPVYVPDSTDGKHLRKKKCPLAENIRCQASIKIHN